MRYFLNKLQHGRIMDAAGEGGEGGGGNPDPAPTGGSLLTGAPSGTPPATPPVGGEPEPVEPIKLDGWKAGLPKEYLDNKTIAQLPDNRDGFLGGLKSLVNAQSLVGQDVIPQPRDSWTQEQWNEHFDKSGRPEAAEDYEVKLPESFPQDLQLDKEKIAGWQKFFHETGLTKQQGEKLITTFLRGVQADYVAMQQNKVAQAEADIAALREQTGEKFPIVVEKANLAIIKTGAEEFLKVITDHGLQNNPVVAQYLAKIHDMLADDVVTGVGTGDGGFKAGGSRADAMARMTELKSDPAWTARYLNKSDPGHRAAVEEMNKLRKIAYAK